MSGRWQRRGEGWPKQNTYLVVAVPVPVLVRDCEPHGGCDPSTAPATASADSGRQSAAVRGAATLGLPPPPRGVVTASFPVHQSRDLFHESLAASVIWPTLKWAAGQSWSQKLPRESRGPEFLQRNSFTSVVTLHTLSKLLQTALQSKTSNFIEKFQIITLDEWLQ